MFSPKDSSDIGVGMDTDRKSEDNGKSLVLTQTHGSIHVGNVVSVPDQLKRHRQYHSSPSTDPPSFMFWNVPERITSGSVAGLT